MIRIDSFPRRARGAFLGAALGAFLLSPGTPAKAQDGEPVLELLPTPAPTGSSLSRLTRSSDGQVYLSWVVEGNDGARLQYASYGEEGWNTPMTISEGRDWFINWADFPALSVSGDALVAHWLQRSGRGTYDYDIAARFFDPATGAWSPAIVVNNDGVSAEHGFVSLLPVPGGTLVSWLDGRYTKRQPDAGPMSLRAARFDARGQRWEDTELDGQVCDCCQTASAMTARGPVVVYRDRSPEEIRDIAIVRQGDGRWSEPAIVAADHWHLQGCPVNGPAVAAADDAVAVAWFSAADDIPAVRLARSADSGVSFNTPVTVARGDTSGRVGVALLDNDEIVVSWVALAPDHAAGASIMLSRYSAAGEFRERTRIASMSASRRSGFPTIESVGRQVFVSWTDISGTPRVRVARVSYP